MNILLLILFLCTFICFGLITLFYIRKCKQIQQLLNYNVNKSRSNSGSQSAAESEVTDKRDEGYKRYKRYTNIEKLAGHIAHEINNPLSFIGWNFQTMKHNINNIKKMLKYNHFDADSRGLSNAYVPERIFAMLTHIDDLLNDNSEGLLRIKEITEHLKWLAQKNTTKKVELLYLNDIIESTLLISRKKINQFAEVIVRRGTIPRIICNSGEIKQVVMNLLINSCQAIQEKSNEKKGIIVIKTWADNKYVNCSINDNGCGIPKENLSKIFEPFFTTKKPGYGIGWGLYIAYDIITNQYNGKFWVKSRMGEGTRVTLKIPRNVEADND